MPTLRLCLAALLAAPTAAVASVPPEAVAELQAHPERVTLTGWHDSAQLVVTARLKDGRLADVTGEADYSLSARAARVTPSGRVLPLADGPAAITARFAGRTVRIPVKVEKTRENLPLNFGNQVVPIFTKLTCNSGGCHGKASGQNGFKLSLLGFDAKADYAALVVEARGRRVMPSAPDHSLLLRKAVGAAPHGGGKRMDKDSDEYKLIRRWVAAGMPFGKETDPTVVRVSVYPEHRVMGQRSRQQFAAYAHYSDGSVEDITRRAKYESNDKDIAAVGESALVRTQALSGEAAIMARYQGHVAVFRCTVPMPGPAPKYDFPHHNFIDALTHKKWRQLGLAPSPVCTDAEFIRRASLDIAGTLPTPDRVTKFLADDDPKKRAELVDRLLDSPEYAYFFANKWADILKVRRDNRREFATGTFRFHNWIRQAVADDKPFDEFARGVLAATGDEQSHPPTVWYRHLTKPEQFVDDACQVFLGQRLACANCHHHPYEKWGQDDYWGMAAFFGRVGRKAVPLPGQARNRNTQQQVIYTRTAGSVRNKRTGKTAPMKPLDADPVEVTPGDDPRQALVDWLTAKKNPFFARAAANRYWAHFLGRGLVDPLDDMRVTNPPSNPELLDALAADFAENGYSLKRLVRLICTSRTYQLSATPTARNRPDRQNYARYYPRRLSAEVLFDAVNRVTGSPSGFGEVPQDRFAPDRAIMLFDESFRSYFLDVFGRPRRISACECERVSEANLAQMLHLLNSNEVQGKITRGGGRADRLAKDKRPDRDKVAELFLCFYARRPTDGDMKNALAHIAKKGKDKKAAYEDLIWALVNTKEFIFNH